MHSENIRGLLHHVFGIPNFNTSKAVYNCGVFLPTIKVGNNYLEVLVYGHDSCAHC